MNKVVTALFAALLSLTAHPQTSGLPAVTSIANVQVIGPTVAIPATSCTTPVQVPMAGVTSTSAIFFSFASNPSTVTGWGGSAGLSFKVWPTTGNLNWSVCNTIGASVTPGAITFNVGAR